MSVSGKQTLGRGLSALLGEDVDDYTAMDRLRSSKFLPVDQLQPSPYQPRRQFSSEDMQFLTDSVREKGVLQPLLVRRDKRDAGRYEIIAGERRWRAAKAAGLSEVPVVIKDLTDRDVLEVALIENVQRQDLSPIEEAAGYQRLIDEFGHTQDALARVIGKSRSHIANMLRLLKLPESVRALLDQQQISMGHARALVALPDPETLAQAIIERHLTVRDIEKLGQEQKLSPVEITPKKLRPPETRSYRRECDAIEESLTRILGLKVQVRIKRRGGELTIQYKNTAELQAIVKRLTDIPALLAD